MDVSAASVKELREKTGAGFMDCKKALGETGGDLEKAVDYLRQKGLAAAAKKADRTATDGAVVDAGDVRAPTCDCSVVTRCGRTDTAADGAIGTRCGIGETTAHRGIGLVGHCPSIASLVVAAATDCSIVVGGTVARSIIIWIASSTPADGRIIAISGV